MNKKDKLRAIIREEIKKELKEGATGAAIGYIVGILLDLFFKKKAGGDVSRSPEEIEKELKTKLDRRYQTDPKFRKMVDDIAAGNIVV